MSVNVNVSKKWPRFSFNTMKVEFAKILFDQYLFLRFLNYQPMTAYQKNRILFYEAVELLLDNVRQQHTDYMCALDRFVFINQDECPKNIGSFPDTLTDHIHHICKTFLLESATHPINLDNDHQTRSVVFTATLSPIPIAIFDDLLQTVLLKLLDSVFLEFARTELNMQIPSLHYGVNEEYNWDSEELLWYRQQHITAEDLEESYIDEEDYQANYYESLYPHMPHLQEATPTSPKGRGSFKQSTSDAGIFKMGGSTHDVDQDTLSLRRNRCLSISGADTEVDYQSLERRRPSKLSTTPSGNTWYTSPVECEDGRYYASDEEEIMAVDGLVNKAKSILMTPTKVTMPLLPERAPLNTTWDYQSRSSFYSTYSSDQDIQTPTNGSFPADAFSEFEDFYAFDHEQSQNVNTDSVGKKKKTILGKLRISTKMLFRSKRGGQSSI